LAAIHALVSQTNRHYQPLLPLDRLKPRSIKGRYDSFRDREADLHSPRMGATKGDLDRLAG
jgi:hypothetical protein